VGRTDVNEAFLLGVLSTPGLNGSFFRSDVVLGNTSGQSSVCDLSFTSTGFQSEPTPTISEALLPGESLRLADVVSEWNVGDTGWACSAWSASTPRASSRWSRLRATTCRAPRSSTVSSCGPSPVRTRPAPAIPHVLAASSRTRQTRTTVWLFNPSDDEPARYNIRYLDLEGNDLGGETGLPLGQGKFRQINPGSHPFVEEPGQITGPGGFVVVVEVTAGRVLSAAQVVNAANDPAYIVGQ
jgi:hypothetical protein